MFITKIKLRKLSNILCLPENKLSQILYSSRTLGDVLLLDLGLKDKVVETNLKNSIVSTLYNMKG